MRRLLAAALTGALLLLIAVPAFAQEPPYPPPPPTVTVDAAAVVAGGTITLTGEDWLPGSEVTITLVCPGADFERVLGTATVDEDGRFTTQVTIPADAPPGECFLRISGFDLEGQPRVEEIPITITAPAAVVPVDRPAPVTPAPRLVPTGLELTTGILAVSLLLLAGIGALFVARRRARSEA